MDNARRENQSENPAWQIERKNHMRQVREGLFQTDKIERFETIEQQVDTFFAEYQPASRSLVVLADGEALVVYELPIPMASQVYFGEPNTVPLLWVMDEYEPYLIVQVDNEQVRFISAYLGSADTNAEMKLEIDDYDFRERLITPAGNTKRAGGGRDRYNAMINAHVKRFYGDVIDEMKSLQEELRTRRVILSGNERAAHALLDEISPADRKRIVGVVAAPMTLTAGEVLARVLSTALDYERAQEHELVQTIINEARAGGRGALGPEAVIEAIVNQQAEMLVLPYPPRDGDIADDLKQRAFQHGVEIELVHGEPADMLQAAGGAAARLYYAV